MVQGCRWRRRLPGFAPSPPPVVRMALIAMRRPLTRMKHERPWLPRGIGIERRADITYQPERRQIDNRQIAPRALPGPRAATRTSGYAGGRD